MQHQIQLQTKWVYNMRVTERKLMKTLTLKAGLYTLLGIAVCVLVGYNIKDRIFGSPLSVTTATDGTTLSNPFLPITGTAKHARELLINGRSVAIDRKGHFDDEVLLSPGYNIVEVALRDQFGKTQTKTYHVVMTSSAAVAAVVTTPYQ